MTGAPADSYDHATLASPDSRSIGDWLFDQITTAIAANGMVSAITPAGSDSTSSITGMVQGHVYTVLGTFNEFGEKLY